MSKSSKRFCRINTQHRKRASVFAGSDGSVTTEAVRQLLNEHRCGYCGETPPKNKRTIDHIIPLSRFGKHCVENLLMACDRCNQEKGNLTGVEFFLLRKNKRETKKFRKKAVKIIGIQNKILKNLRTQ